MSPRRAFLDDIEVISTTPPAGDTFASWITGYHVGTLTGPMTIPITTASPTPSKTCSPPPVSTSG